MRKVRYILILAGLLVAGCGKNGSDPIPSPEKAMLTFPEMNALCTQGTVVSAGKTSVVFKWASAANAESYDLSLKNLLTSVITTTSANTNQLSVTLDVNTPYSWSITSRSSKTAEISQSDTWKFYNSGPGVLSYAPYPAEITAPTMKQRIAATGSKVTLSWLGSDVDNDVAGYDVYFGTAATPPLFKSALTAPTLTDVAVSAGSTYYWKVVTTDSKGNTSDSGIYQFTVN